MLDSWTLTFFNFDGIQTRDSKMMQLILFCWDKIFDKQIVFF